MQRVTYYLKLNLLLVFLLSFFIVKGQEADLSKAEKSYKEERYKDAISVYKKLIDEGYHSSSMYYNLGNCYYKANDLGNARLYYEKALKYAPYNEEVNKNLNIVIRDLDSEIVELPDFFLLRWWRGFTGIFSSNVWAAISILLAIGLVFLIWAKLFSNFELSTLYGKVGYPLVVLLLLSVLASYFGKSRIEDNSNVIISKNVRVLSGPDERSELLYNLNEGEKVKLIDSIKQWYQVKLLNKEVGWIEGKQFLKI